jgi:hypothetical protein
VAEVPGQQDIRPRLNRAASKQRVVDSPPVRPATA